MILLLTLACGPADTPEPSAPDTAPPPITSPSEYTYEAPEQTRTLLSAAEVSEGLAALLAQPLALNSVPLIGAYERIMAQSDDDCPDYYESDGDLFWYDNCSSDAGALFDGYGFYTYYEDESDGQTSWTGDQLTGLATVRSAEGYTFEVGGAALLLEGEGVDSGYDYLIHYSYVVGGFGWDGPEAQGTWLEQGADPDLLLYAVDYPSISARYLLLQGGLSADGPISALVFDDLTVANAAAGIKCPEEPMGGLSVRDAAGNWYTLTFDGEGGGPRGNRCDGCAALMFEDQDLGAVCLDTATWLDWEESPW